jgi:hypothetical protein
MQRRAESQDRNLQSGESANHSYDRRRHHCHRTHRRYTYKRKIFTEELKYARRRCV